MSHSALKRLVVQNETNVKECKVCKEKKLRILYGKFPSMDNKYVDEKGDLWSGRTCPPCNKERIKNKMKDMRIKRKRNIGEELIQSLEEMVVKK